MSNSTFKEIQRDSDVCSNCFRKTHERYERNYRVEVVQVENEEGKLEWTTQAVSVEGVEITLPNGDTEVIGEKDDLIVRDREATIKIPEKGAHRGKRTICACGFRWGPKEQVDEWKNRPLKKRKFFEYADRLLDRLHEAGVSLDEDAYYDRLDQLKSNPDNQFADDAMYSQAIDHAVALANS